MNKFFFIKKFERLGRFINAIYITIERGWKKNKIIARKKKSKANGSRQWRKKIYICESNSS